MTRKSIPRSAQVIIWVTLYGFWVILSLDRHPTFTIDLVVTAILLSAYMSAVYLNLLLFVPRFWNRGRKLRYGIVLASSMLTLTLLALISLRESYALLLANGADLLGDFWMHYGIDLAGMIVHVGVATGVVALLHRKSRSQN